MTFQSGRKVCAISQKGPKIVLICSFDAVILSHYCCPIYAPIEFPILELAQPRCGGNPPLPVNVGLS